MKDIKLYTQEAIEKLTGYGTKKDDEIKQLKSLIGTQTSVRAGLVEVVVTITEEDIQKRIEDVNTEYSKKAEPVLEELMKTLVDASKEAKQEYYAAEPVATAEQRLVVADIVKAYKEDKNNALNKDEVFMETLEEHVTNQTVKALPYVLSLKELVPGIDIEPYLMRIAPDMKVAKDKMQIVKEANTQFRLYELREQAKQPNLTVSDRISIKREYFELGGNPNMDLHI